MASEYRLIDFGVYSNLYITGNRKVFQKKRYFGRGVDPTSKAFLI